MFLDFMTDVESVLRRALSGCGFVIPENGTNELQLQISPHADISSSVAFRLAPLQKQSPKSIADRLRACITLDGTTSIDRVEQAGPYLNFFMNRRFLNDVAERARADRCLGRPD